MTHSRTIILASASPRRHELLSQIGVKFEVLSVDTDESCFAGEDYRACVERVSLDKARAALAEKPDAIVIGSDTMVIVDGRAFGKPADREDALRMLECLSGRDHEVLTGVAVISREREVSMVQPSVVSFREISSAEARAYWQTGEPVDKAGGYAIQGLGARFVERLQGSYSGVMGLPVCETVQLLERFGVNTLGTSLIHESIDNG